METHDVEYYMLFPYSILLIPEEDGSWFAKVPELPGCMTYGDTQAEAPEMIEDAKRLWIIHNLAEGRTIPYPTVMLADSK
jgi:predicted RNase H-like HicB family nuclease